MATNEQQPNNDQNDESEDEFTDPIDLPKTFAYFDDSDDQQEEQANSVKQSQKIDSQKPEPPTLKYDKQKVLERTRGLSFFKVLLNFLKSLIGVGFLALPLAFHNAGLWASFALLLFSALLNYYCMEQLIENAQYHYRRLDIPFLSYGNLAKHACQSSFPWIRKHKYIAKQLVNGAILLLEFGFCSTYYLFIAKSLQEICVSFFDADVRIWLVIIYLPMVLLTFVRSLRILSYFSLVGNVLMLMSLIYIFYVLIEHLVTAEEFITPVPIGSFLKMFIAFGSIIFSFEAQTLVLPLERELKKPHQMSGMFGILFCGIFFSTIVYISVGALGYLTYGSCVGGSITQNLKSGTSTLVKLALIVSICSCFLLQMYVIVEVLWARIARMTIAGENFKKTNAEKDKKKRCWQLPSSFKFCCELFFRTLMVSVCFAFTYAVPSLERIIPLVGSASGMLLAFVYPALIDLFTFVPLFLSEGRRQKAIGRLCVNIVLVCVGLFGMVAGLVGSIKELIEGQNIVNMCGPNATINANATR